ncbi:MAG TPA: SDR family oxidoreductase [Candidatus Kapabacteria bacterium]|nr:SDR family oxidoreductase [Candidatus Kapabacteria bacterium]
MHKRTLITGGVRRLGLHIAYGFAERHAILGLNYLHATEREADHAQSECLKRGATQVFLIKGDVTKEAEAIVGRFAKLAGGIDVVVSNAGVFPKRHSLNDLTLKQFEETLSLNLLAPFAISKASASHMMNGGAIINLASLGGMQIWKERIDYNVSKSALITLTKALARELAPKNITVNAVAPGAIQVDSPEGAAVGAHHTDLHHAELGIAEEKIPLGRYGTPENIVRAVLYFAYDAPYVTGQTLVVDGGRSVING